MSDITTHTQDTFHELCGRADAALRTVAKRIRELPEEARGQTAAEYMGILLIVSLIIAAVVKTDIAKTISERVGAIVDAIAHGKDAG